MTKEHNCAREAFSNVPDGALGFVLYNPKLDQYVSVTPKWNVTAEDAAVMVKWMLQELNRQTPEAPHGD